MCRQIPGLSHLKEEQRADPPRKGDADEKKEMSQYKAKRRKMGSMSMGHTVEGG